MLMALSKWVFQPSTFCFWYCVQMWTWSVLLWDLHTEQQTEKTNNQLTAHHPVPCLPSFHPLGPNFPWCFPSFPSTLLHPLFRAAGDSLKHTYTHGAGSQWRLRQLIVGVGWCSRRLTHHVGQLWGCGDGAGERSKHVIHMHGQHQLKQHIQSVIQLWGWSWWTLQTRYPHARTASAETTHTVSDTAVGMELVNAPNTLSTCTDSISWNNT